ncbi:facilitated trehalose transporter Tret1-like [Coccinella septempunctata]|uniref:facilitated trehalose transporter Tret1-like n=1 Tax=Coccinella septempunctata TaxID=41139 RepID=UPI001D05C8D8|nr:facilitated trehalose transporter Tret1-like [Coccinella septempunctata]
MKMAPIFAGTEIVQYLAVFFASLNIITSGLGYGWPSGSLPHLLNFNDTSVNLHLTPSEGSWAAIGPLVGAIIGSPLAGITLDLVGRRRMILFTFFPYVTSWLIVAFTSSPEVLIFGRMISGISDGCLFTSAPIYIGEIAKPKVRGLLCSSIPVCLISGVLLINILEAFISVPVCALLVTILPTTSFIGMLFMPESPYYLLMKDKSAEAQETLERLRGTEEVDEELKRMSEAVRSQKEESRGKFKDIFTVASNRKALLIMMLLRATQQFSGITALIFYISIILEESGSQYSVTLCTLLFFAVQLVMSILGSAVVDWTGRRMLLLWSAFGSGVALFVEGLYFQLDQDGTDVTRWAFIPITALIVYVIFYGFGLQNIPLLMLGELFPTNIKAIALCFGDLYFAALASIVSKYFQVVSTDIGPFFAFYTFSACCFVGLCLIYLFVPETKGITLEEIQSLLKTGKKFTNQKDSADKEGQMK